MCELRVSMGSASSLRNRGKIAGVWIAAQGSDLGG